MTGPSASPLSLIDGVDVEAVAGAARACRGVGDLESGFPEVASYLIGRRVPGVRVVGDAIEVQIRAEWGIPVFEVAAAVQAAVAPLASGHAVNVTIADLGDPGDTTAPATALSDQRDAADLNKPNSTQAHTTRPPLKAQGDPLLAEALHKATPAAVLTGPERASEHDPGSLPEAEISTAR